MKTNTRTKHEQEVSDAIHSVSREIEKYLRPRGCYRTPQVEGQLYYDQDGSNPSRFLEVHLNDAHLSLRVAVQRNETRRPAWTLYWTTYEDNKEVGEGRRDAGTTQKLLDVLREILDQHELLIG